MIKFIKNSKHECFKLINNQSKYIKIEMNKFLFTIQNQFKRARWSMQRNDDWKEENWFKKKKKKKNDNIPKQ